MRISGKSIFCTLVFIFTLMAALPAAFADENTAIAAEAKGLAAIIELLQKKQVLTPEEARALAQVKDNGNGELEALLNLLKGKNILNDEDVSALRRPAQPQTLAEGGGSSLTKGETEQLVMPGAEKEFIDLLRTRWVKNGNRKRDFNNLFAETRDVTAIIERMRVMGAISSQEADELESTYRNKYLTGVVSTVIESKESQYLERLKKDVDWQIDQKLHSRLKDEWWQRVKLSGDFRLRFEDDYYGQDNGDFLQPSNPTQTLNSHVDRDRLLVRLRLGVDAKVADDVKVGVSLASGNTTNPVSTNATLGDSLNKKSIQIDRSYIAWTPTPQLTLLGGRFTNPWFATDLVWDQDVNFDGVAFQYQPQLNSSWGLFLTGGAFPIQEVDLSSKDKWLFGGQFGFNYKPSDKLQARLGAAYYDYEHTVGVANTPANPTANNWTAPGFQQKGNTLMNIAVAGSPALYAYASKFRELNVTGTLDLGNWHPVHVMLTGDYVYNLGYKQSDVVARAGYNVDKNISGYQFGVTVGHPVVSKFGDWKGLFFYKYLGSDAVMDAFTDSDFHLGGTNAKGWIAGGDFGLTNNVWFAFRWFTTDEINYDKFAVDVLQLNINAKF